MSFEQELDRAIKASKAQEIQGQRDLRYARERHLFLAVLQQLDDKGALNFPPHEDPQIILAKLAAKALLSRIKS